MTKFNSQTINQLIRKNKLKEFLKKTFEDATNANLKEEDKRKKRYSSNKEYSQRFNKKKDDILLIREIEKKEKIKTPFITKKYFLKEIMEEFIKERNNFMLNLTLNSDNFHPVNLVYKNKSYLNFPSKYEQYSMLNNVKFLLNFENRLIKEKEKRKLKEKKKSSTLILIFFPILILYLIYKNKKKIKLFFNNFFNKIKNYYYYYNFKNISLFIIILFLFLYFLKNSKIKAEEINENSNYNHNEDFYGNDEAIEEYTVNQIIISAILSVDDDINSICEGISESDISKEEFDYCFNLYEEKTKLFEYYLAPFPYDELKSLKRKDLIFILQCKKYILLNLIESFAIDFLLQNNE